MSKSKNNKSKKTMDNKNIFNKMKECIYKSVICCLIKEKNPYIKLHMANFMEAIQNVLLAFSIPVFLVLASVNLTYFRGKLDIKELNYTEVTGEVYALSFEFVLIIMALLILVEIIKRYYESVFYVIYKKDSMDENIKEVILKGDSLKKDKSLLKKMLSTILSVFIFLNTKIKDLLRIDWTEIVFNEDILRKYVTKENMDGIINLANQSFNIIILIAIVYLVYKLIFPNYKNMVKRCLALVEKKNYKEIVFNESNKADADK